MDQVIRKTPTTKGTPNKLNPPFISIVIPCYNDYLFIERAVDSALAQTYPNKEIIVVDDGSNDQTKAKLNSLAAKIDILISQQNKGTSAARNAGIRIANGEYILVHDSDDYFEPDFCEKAIDAFSSNDKVVLVTCYARWFRNNRDFEIFKPRGGRLNDVLFSNIAMGSSMFKKNDWLMLDGYDEAMVKGFEDWEFYLRLHKKGGETWVIPEVLFHYRKKLASRNSVANENKYELLQYIYLKHSELYKENFESFTRHLINFLEISERKKIKKDIPFWSRFQTNILLPVRKFLRFIKVK